MLYLDGIIYSIAEVSERLEDISYRTLHFWEEKFGLNINRDTAGNRIYTEYDVELFDKIIELKKRGMTLDGIKTLLQERGLVPIDEENGILVIDEKSMEIKDILIAELRMAVSEQVREALKETNDKLNIIITENEALKDEVRQLSRKTEDHYSKLDRQITSWREARDRPWYKKIFTEKGEKK